MGSLLDEWRRELRSHPRRWLVTGAAGFIGSHLVAELLGLGQEVRGLDDLSTGSLSNLEQVRGEVGERAWRRFVFTRGDAGDHSTARAACHGVHFVLHQAARGSVPRSLADPLATHAANVEGFLSMLDAARREGCARFVYASSSSVYGDSLALPRREDELGTPLSPYAASKRIDELYAGVYHRSFGVPVVGLRYFNVFGPRQDPDGPYAAVLPRWIVALLGGGRPVVHGDGSTTRDFCPVANVVAANLLATREGADILGRVYNVGLGEEVDLLTALRHVRECVAAHGIACAGVTPRYDAARPGDVPRSLADLSRARRELAYAPGVGFREGLRAAVAWFAAARRRGEEGGR